MARTSPLRVPNTQYGARRETSAFRRFHPCLSLQSVACICGSFQPSAGHSQLVRGLLADARDAAAEEAIGRGDLDDHAVAIVARLGVAERIIADGIGLQVDI